MPKAAHRRGTYRRRAKAVTDAAYADPSTTCWRCGKTLAEHGTHRNGTPATWDAGHLIDGDEHSPLAAEASTCNRSAGATLGNHNRYHQPNTTTRAW